MTREALPRKASVPDGGYGEGMYHTAPVLSINNAMVKQWERPRLSYTFNGQVVALRDSGTNAVTYLHNDHLGSVSMTTDAAQVKTQQEFDPWGKVRSGGITQTSINYTGQRLDGTGLLYYHARMYDPNLGRFVSADSVVPGSASGSMDGVALKPLTVDFHEPGFVSSLNAENQQGFWFQLGDEQRQQAGSQWGPANPQALNRYSYVQNNPLRYTDPTGHLSGSRTYWIDSKAEAVDVMQRIADILIQAGAEVSIGVEFGVTISGNLAPLRLGDGLYRFLKGLMEYLSAYLQGYIEGPIWVDVQFEVYNEYVGSIPTRTYIGWRGGYGRCRNPGARCDIRDPNQTSGHHYNWRDQVYRGIPYDRTVGVFNNITEVLED